MNVWNSNSAAETAIGWGVKDVLIEYSVDGENWEVLEGANQLSRAPGSSTYDTYDVIDFGGVAAKYVRLDIQNNWGGILMSYSLSEVQFFMIPAEARSPEPASGSVDVLPNTLITWRAGREAAQHTLYVSPDMTAVSEGSAPSLSSSTNSLDLSSLNLALDESYYWRVDEVNEAEAVPVWAGPVWSFSTPSVLVVDDFESYSNISPNRPFQAWLDGFGYSVDEFFPAGYGGNGTHFNIGSLGGPGGIGAHCWGWEETMVSDEEGLNWHHYAMTYDGTTIAYFLDGMPMDSDPANSNVQDLSASGDRVHIGSRVTQTSSFPGNVDDAVIYDRALSAEEILWIAGRTTLIDKPF